jgi:hypothetical protein
MMSKETAAARATDGWIGVDLDGTLAEYHGWTSKTHIGAPIPAMVERVKQWLREDKEVKIFTARATTWARSAELDAEVEMAIRDWCEKHIGQKLPVTNMKDMNMIELWDDRCVQVEPNTGEPVTFWQSRV